MNTSVTESFARTTGALAIAFVALSACTVGGRETLANPSGSVIISTSRPLPRLPFGDAFPNRLNSANDGTTYEPCTALTASVAAELKVDLASAHDAATVDHQTARGCVWTYLADSRWAITQIVGNSESVDSYKRQRPMLTWRTDTALNGRVVAVAEASESVCATHVQSGRAGVATIAEYDAFPYPSIDEICARAIEFTRATIDKMPK